jgi:exopolysaccharide biosynthesis protein
MWLAKINMRDPGIRFALTEPSPQTGEDGKKYETLCQTTLEFAKARGVQLAINTSAFSPFRAKAGEPMDVSGLAVTDGKPVSEATRSNGAIYIEKDNRVRLKGPALKPDDAVHVVPGFRLLLDDEKLVVPDRDANTSFGGVNPRTAVGVDRDGSTLWIVVVDGRQPGVSAGITLVELATLFESLGAWDTLNLDGGGSSTFVLQGKDGTPRVINTPVGNRTPGSLRQVGHNLGLYLPR